jgi:hypothetical protein
MKANLAHYRGDSLVLKLTLWTDAAKTTPADLTEATVTAQVREQYDDTEVAAAFDVQVTGNTIVANLSPKNARDLPPKAFYDIQVDWYSDDTSVQTVVAGGLTAAPDVTREAV